MFIDYPSVQKEISIINAKLPGVPESLARDVALVVCAIRRNERIFKKPSIAETLDWVSALMAIDKKRLDEEGIEKTLGFLLKNREDMLQIRKDGGLNGILDGKCD